MTTVLAYEPNWKRNLNEVTGLTNAIVDHLDRILKDGPLPALKACQNKAAEVLADCQ